MPGGGAHPLQQPWGQSAAGCGGPGGTFSAGAPYPGGYAYPNGTGGSGAPGESCAYIPSLPGVDGGAVRDPVGVGCFALGVAIAFWQGIERFSVLYLREKTAALTFSAKRIGFGTTSPQFEAVANAAAFFLAVLL